MPIMTKAPRPARLFWRCASLLVAATALSACAVIGMGHGKGGRYVYQADNDYVRLESIEPGAPPNAHPFTIPAAGLRELLANIKVSGTTSMNTIAVFSKPELDAIVPPLASALAQAHPNQDVTFAVASHRGIFGTLSPEATTTGRVFVRGGSLNLIFGVIQYRKDNDVLDSTGVAPEPSPGVRARRVGSVVWKIEPDSARFRERRGDWLVFNRSVTSAAAQRRAVVPAPRAGAEPAAADRKEQEIESRLRVLEDLRKKGVITEQEYRERRRAILQSL